MHPGMSTHSEIFNVKGNPRDKADEEGLTHSREVTWKWFPMGFLWP